MSGPAPEEPGRVPPPPDVDTLVQLAADPWAWLLPHLRRALDAVDDEHLDARGIELRAAPTGRLVGGPGRRELCAVVVSPVVWPHVHRQLARAEPVPEELVGLLGGAGPAASSIGRQDVTAPPAGSVDAPTTRSARDRQRLKAMRAERDAARRRADGAQARADALRRELHASQVEVDELRARVAELDGQLQDADSTRQRAVERERRRREAEVAELKQQLATLRRADEERRAQERRRAAARDQAVTDAARAPASGRDRGEPPRTRLVPGRPSQLPEGVAPGTTEAVALFLHRGRRVLVDGYNVTLTHRQDLELERQRTWLIDALGNLARQHGVVPTVVFDGDAVGGTARSGGGREVTVRFSGEGIPADDEIVLELESTDEPVLVVTDDRDLTERCRRAHADVITTTEFLWVLR